MKNSQPPTNELNFIGAGTYLEGNIETQGSLRVDGKIKGTVKSGDTITIGASGEIEGEVFARNAVVGGKIKGNITTEEKLILEATSALSGNLRASKLIIDEGAVFNGKSQMGKNAKADFPEKPVKEERAMRSGVVTEGAFNASTKKE